MRIAALPFALLLALSPAARAFDEHIVALWHLDDGAGDTAIDAGPWGDDLGFRHYPLASSFPVWRQNGCQGGAVDFARHDQESGGYLSSSASIAFPQNELTIELWVATTTRPYGVLFSAGSNQLELSLDDHGAPRFFVGNQTTWSNPAVSAFPVDDGYWHQVAGTYDGATLRIYVDGVQRGSEPYTATIATLPGFYVGGRPQAKFVDGAIDEVRLSDVARDAQSIADAWDGLRLLCPEPNAALSGAGAIAALARMRRRRPRG